MAMTSINSIGRRIAVRGCNSSTGNIFKRSAENRDSPFGTQIFYSGVRFLSFVALLGGLAVAHAQTPTVLGPVVTQVAAASDHTCALTASGGVQCWGSNNLGQLGNGSATSSQIPVPVSGLSSGVVAIATAASSTCALTTSGGVECWGSNAQGQLGNGSTTDSSTPVPVTGLGSGVAAITVGAGHACAVTTLGAVNCWGLNASGQLGNNSLTNSSVPVVVNGFTGGAIAVAAGANHTCALTTSGAVRCWGSNAAGQVGNGSTTNTQIPVLVSGLSSGIASIAAGNSRSCALTLAGGVQCWGGDSAAGGPLPQSSTPAAVSGLASGITSIALGGSHICAVTASGGVQCVGRNNLGQLGNNSTTDSLAPVTPIGLGSNAASVVAGTDDSCALTTFGEVECWGGNSAGQLGNNSTTQSSVPVWVATLASRVKVDSPAVAGLTATVAPSYQFTCALTEAGGVWCWGTNSSAFAGGPTNHGQLGDNSTADSTVPVPVSGLVSGVVSVKTGANFACALTAAGVVECWGSDDSGQLANSAGDSLVPVVVNGLGGAAATISAGGQHACAVLTSTGALLCWGHNDYGQIGNGTFGGNFPVPQQVQGLTSGIVAVAAEATMTCALNTAGGVQCWGNNSDGSLGNGNPGVLASVSPVQVVGLTSGVAAIAGGSDGDTTCALSPTGGVVCWGYNGSGQVGHSAFTPGPLSRAFSPVPVDGLSSGVAAVAVGPQDGCALLTTGAMQCWGRNDTGELGNNSNTDSSSPTGVNGLSSGVASLGGTAQGIDHVCALTSAGRLLCWGDDSFGELGNNSATSSAVPVSILAGQSQTFSVPAVVNTGATVALSAAATGGGPVVFDSWTPSTCTISGTTLTILANTTGGLCGVRVSQAGGFDAADGTIAEAPQQLRLIQIVPIITVLPPTLPAGTVAVPYSQLITAIGGTAPYTFALTAGTLPAGLTLLSDGTLSGTPTAGGTFPLTVVATDANGFTGTINYNLLINPPIIVINPPTLPSGTVGVPYSQTLVASGGTPTYTLVVTGGTLPPGTTLDPNTGLLGGVPTVAGTFNFTVTATDSSTGTGPYTGTRDYTVVINAAGAATMSLVSSLNPSNVGQSVTFTATVTGNTPIGTVTFTADGSNVLCSAVVLTGGGNSPTAACTTSTLTAGSHPIVASYVSGDANNGNAAANLTQVVNPTLAATMSIVSSLNPSTVGDSVTFKIGRAHV